MMMPAASEVITEHGPLGRRLQHMVWNKKGQVRGVPHVPGALLPLQLRPSNSSTVVDACCSPPGQRLRTWEVLAFQETATTYNLRDVRCREWLTCSGGDANNKNGGNGVSTD